MPDSYLGEVLTVIALEGGRYWVLGPENEFLGEGRIRVVSDVPVVGSRPLSLFASDSRRGQAPILMSSEIQRSVRSKPWTRRLRRQGHGNHLGRVYEAIEDNIAQAGATPLKSSADLSRLRFCFDACCTKNGESSYAFPIKWYHTPLPP